MSTADLTALVADPKRAVEVPVSAIPGLLTAASAERERLAAAERALLARLTGTDPDQLAAAGQQEPKRPRGAWLRPEQVAEEYGISRATAYDWVYRKRVTTKKLGKAKRAPVLLYRPDVEKLATVRRPVRPLLDAS